MQSPEAVTPSSPSTERQLSDLPVPQNAPSPETVASHTPERRSGDLVVPQGILYYLIVAILFFGAGFVVSWLVFTLAGQDQIKKAASEAASGAVGTAIAELASGNVAAGPTPTVIPRQNISLSDRMPSWGSPSAKVTLVEFSDFQCPYCDSFFQRTYPKLRETYGSRIRFVFRHFPLTSIHPDAEPASLAAECAKEQGKFWEYHDTLFSNQRNLSKEALVKYASDVKVSNIDQFTQCFTSRKYQQVVDQDMQDGATHFVNATPTFFVNGVMLVGAQPFEVFQQVIEQELRQAGG